MGLRTRFVPPSDRAGRGSGPATAGATGPTAGSDRSGPHALPQSVSLFPFAFLRSAADLLRSALPSFQPEDVFDAAGFPTDPGATA